MAFILSIHIGNALNPGDDMSNKYNVPLCGSTRYSIAKVIIRSFNQ